MFPLIREGGGCYAQQGMELARAHWLMDRFHLRCDMRQGPKFPLIGEEAVMRNKAWN